jgi:hypothetical protein
MGTIVTEVALDSNPVSFSLAAVGAHISGTDISSKVTLSKPAGATGLLAQNTGTAAIRFTLDGTDPTTTKGFQLPASMPAPILIPCPGAAIEVIREGAGAALEGQWVR